MDTYKILQTINALLAIVAVPPSIILILALGKEKYFPLTPQWKVNKALVYLFAGIALGALINASIALFVVFGDGRMGHDISPYRSIFINMFFSSMAWVIYYIRNEISK